jgi:hypothetical protein
MDFAEGGKIDTVEYSAAIGALNSTASAGIAVAIRINPASKVAARQSAGSAPDRSRLSANLMHRHI